MNEQIFLRMLIIIHSQFGNYKISSEVDDYNELYDWHDFANMYENCFKRPSSSFFALNISCNFNINQENILIEIPSAITIYGGKSRGIHELGVEIYADVFTDFIYFPFFDGTKWLENMKLENSHFAKKNRLKFNSFLLELKRLINAEVIEYSSLYYKNDTFNQNGFLDEMDYK